MGMSRNDAELFYDGAIPPGAIDPSAPDRFTLDPLPVMARMTFKPEVIRRRLARTIARLAPRGAITRDDLRQQGFTEAQIADHYDAALDAAMHADPAAFDNEAVA